MNRIPAPRGRKARPHAAGDGAERGAATAVSPAATPATTPAPTADAIEAIRTALLRFYDARARPLPWRTDRDAYRVWVSEIMLQQTRVETVIPYYERWLERFPTVEALADAGVDDVLHTWQGLGYYSRARHLHAAARIVRERHAGRVPQDTRSLRTLPGIGDYTAGAIASIAYGQPEPAVDGNVRRVLARLLDAAEPGPAWLRATASRLVPPDRPGDFNQALMELGALVCVPRSPRCDECPVRAHCAAFARGTQHERPAPKRPAAVPHFDVGTAVVRDTRGRLLLTRRPDTGLLAGLWQFPGAIAEGAARAGDSAEAGDARTERTAPGPRPRRARSGGGRRGGRHGLAGTDDEGCGSVAAAARAAAVAAIRRAGGPDAESCAAHGVRRRPGSQRPASPLGFVQEGGGVAGGRVEAGGVAEGGLEAGGMADEGVEAGTLEVDGGLIGTVEHVFSHRRESYHVHVFRWRGASAAAGPAMDAASRGHGCAASLPPGHGCADAGWYDPDELTGIAMPAAQRRIAALVKVPVTRV